jgi:VanZ family protein
MAHLRRLDPWVPPLLLMVVIFALSAQPSLNSGLGVIDQVGRKVIHFSEYALLAYLWWRALKTRVSDEAAMLLALAIASAYAATDELHQTFVSGRHGTPVDWLIDTAGAATAMVAVAKTRRRAAA